VLPIDPFSAYLASPDARADEAQAGRHYADAIII